ncbi:SH3 domain-containing protein [Streptomyces cupreus]|uniref:SH3 domain-containing protein n=1 Tax=Streptomyces cupreus TaxID=2759956 RepID=A0A7X1J7T8_9ACTN|nr:SH3 domain-containing protein [Streptomyces cupreus]MBC2905299.1 SH3 domain-containing protein [Streptomyces cupreus]
MRTTPALRTLAVALLTGGSLIAATAGATAAAAAPPTYADGHGGDGGGHGGPIWGTVISHTKLNVREAPTTHADVVTRLSPGSQDRVDCKVRGQSVNGNPDWYWLVGAQGWASAVFVDVGRAHVPTCADPCPEWKDGAWTNWDEPFTNDSWSASSSGSWSASGSWSWSVSGSSSSAWSWLGGW